MRSGFTLVELIIVLALLGVTTALAVPAFNSILRDDDAHTAVRGARALLEDARLTALERATRVQVIVDSADGRYWTLIAGDTIRTGTLTFTDDARLDLRRARARFVWDARSAPVADTLTFVTRAGRVVMTADRWSGAVVVHAR